MPATTLNVQDFLDTSWEDINSPTTSNFFSKMPKYRTSVDAMEETLDFDRSGLNKTRKSVKALYNTGSLFVSNQEYFAENLAKIGDSAVKEAQTDDEMEIGVAFMKFHSLSKQLGAIMKSLMQHLHNIIMFPLDSFLKGDLRDVSVDIKKTFDKAWKDYYTKFAKIEKEKKQLARDHGIYRADISGAEVAEDLEKERRMVQLQMCEYLIKVNEIKMKKGAEFLQHLVEYYQALDTYYDEGRRVMLDFNSCIDSLSDQIHATRQRCDGEKRKLVELRDNLKSQLSNYKDASMKDTGYNLHQIQGNKAHGYEKTGYLLKKSEGMVRKTWLRRKVWVKDGYMYISRSDQTKDPVKLNLLTCQTKPALEDATGRSFRLVCGSQIRTYQFQAEDAKDFEEWVSVLNNAKEAVLMKAFGDSSPDTPVNNSVKELTRSIIAEVRKLPGNQHCCDCGAPGPEWLSTNLGVLVCLECCGTHRQMGVHISRMQSIVIDDLGTSQLLLARVVGNRNFNDILEARLDPGRKPRPSQNITAENREFILDKYEHHKFCIKMYTNQDDVTSDVRQAVLSKDVLALLQVFAEGHNIMAVSLDDEETPLHLAIRHHDGASLHIVDFILQNSRGPDLDRQNASGDNILHYCALYNRTECMKLVLKTRPQLARRENGDGKTPLDVALTMEHDTCVELLKRGTGNDCHVFDHVNVDWDLIQDDHLYDPMIDGADYSDDDLDQERPRKARSRPHSCISQTDVAAANQLSVRSDSPSNLVSLRVAECQSQSNLCKNETPTKAPPLPPPPNRPKTPVSPAPTSGVPLSLKKKPAPPPPIVDSGHDAHNSPSTPSRLVLESGKQQALDNPIYFKGTPHSGLSSSSSSCVSLQTEVKPRSGSSVTNTANSGLINGHRRSKSQDNLVTSSAANNSSGYQGNPSNEQQQAKAGRNLGDKGHHSNESAPPIPTPRNRKRSSISIARRRCRALYPCCADKADELTFKEGEIIVVLKEDDEDWWEGEIEGAPNRRGMFPVSFVHILTDV